MDALSPTNKFTENQLCFFQGETLSVTLPHGSLYVFKGHAVQHGTTRQRTPNRLFPQRIGLVFYRLKQTYLFEMKFLVIGLVTCSLLSFSGIGVWSSKTTAKLHTLKLKTMRTNKLRFSVALFPTVLKQWTSNKRRTVRNKPRSMKFRSLLTLMNLVTTIPSSASKKLNT